MENENLPELAKDINPYKVMDALDDEIIVAEMENRIVEHWVYAFKQDGKMVSNLSKAGVDACCTEMAKSGHIIEEQLVQFAPDPGDPHAFLFTVVASRVLVNLETGQRIIMDTVNGAKRQSMKDKHGKFNHFWFEQGAMKAARNARNRLIPEEVKVKILALAKERKKIKGVTPEDAERVSGQKTTEPKSTANTYADRSKVQAWISDNIGSSDDETKAFKQWAASFPTPKIGKNQWGHYTLDKVDALFAQRLYANPDEAAINFNSWYDLNKAKENVKEVFGDGTSEEYADSRQ